MSNRSCYITRLFDAVSRASGDGVCWTLQVSGADTADAPPTITLTRMADGRTTHIFSDDFPLLGLPSLAEGRILMRKDMIYHRSKVVTRPGGDRVRTRIMDCIKDYRQRLGRSPSQREISETVGISRKTVPHHLRVLEQLGHIEIVRNCYYGIILKEGNENEH